MVCYNQVYILIRDYKKFMNTGFSSFPLGTIRKYVWDEIQEKIRNDSIPYEKDYRFVDANEQTFTVWIQISRDDVLPDMLSVTIMVDKYPCDINNSLGVVSALFSIQNMDDCQIYPNGVQIEDTTHQLDDISLGDLEKYVVESWNK